MTRNIINYIKGSVVVRITGPMPEKLINLCISHHILLWGITKSKDNFYACMRLNDFFKIRPLVKKSGMRVKVISHSGLPFAIKRVKRRKMLITGAIIFLIILNILVSYIWFVDVIGVKTLPADIIKQIAYQNGLKPGILRTSVNGKKIENEILLNVPEIAWVSINFTGTRAVIDVVEKTMPKQEDKTPADIVAVKDGVITEIIALAGQPNVKKNDTVKRGDLLIKGTVTQPVTLNELGQPLPPALPPQLVKANGIVKARVWYEGYGEDELVHTIYEHTGQQEIGIMLKIGDFNISLKKASEQPYPIFETEVIHKKLLNWRNSEVAVESTISIYHELTAKMVTITVDEAREEARARALTTVQSLIPETANILSRNVEIIKTIEPNLVRIKVSVEAIEDIGQSVNITNQ